MRRGIMPEQPAQPCVRRRRADSNRCLSAGRLVPVRQPERLLANDPANVDVRDPGRRSYLPQARTLLVGVTDRLPPLRVGSFASPGETAEAGERLHLGGDRGERGLAFLAARFGPEVGGVDGGEAVQPAATVVAEVGGVERAGLAEQPVVLGEVRDVLHAVTLCNGGRVVKARAA